MYTSITTRTTSAPFTNTRHITEPLRSKDKPMNSLLTAPVDESPSLTAVLIEPKEPDSPPGFGQWDEELGAPGSIKAPVARCADGHGTMVGLFFSDNIIDIARAKAICGKCELAASCLSEALEREEPWGVWGGELLANGRIVRNKRPCGRPPKHPRPELIVDELGVVGSVA